MSLYSNFLAFCWALLIAVFAIPSIINVAHVKKLLDAPNVRTVHSFMVPRLGGVAIFAGFFSALTIFGQFTSGIREMLAGAMLLFFIGVKDDIVSVSAFKKFFVQVLATGIVMFIGDVYITSFYGVLDIWMLKPGISFLFTFLVIIGITNSINLIDGVDGLAGSVISLICITLSLAFLSIGDDSASPYATVAICLLGSVVGFLRYNLNKAIIFMGDAGSLVCGFIVSVLSIKFIELHPVAYAPSLIIAILFIPIIDTLRVFVLRIFKGLSPFSPDKNHLHHRLVGMGMNHLSTVVCLCGINVGSILLVTIFKDLGNNNIIMILTFYAMVVVSVIEILFKRKEGTLVNAG